MIAPTTSSWPGSKVAWPTISMALRQQFQWHRAAGTLRQAHCNSNERRPKTGVLGPFRDKLRSEREQPEGRMTRAPFFGWGHKGTRRARDGNLLSH